MLKRWVFLSLVVDFFPQSADLIMHPLQVIDCIIQVDQKEPVREKNGKMQNPELAPCDPYLTTSRYLQQCLHLAGAMETSREIDQGTWRKFFPIDGHLNNVLTLCFPQDFQSLTKVFSANAPTGSLVIRGYVKLKKSLQGKIDSWQSQDDPLFPMYHAMHVRVKSYLAEALKSDVLILANILHPLWQSDYFQFAFGNDADGYKTAQSLLQTAFDTRQARMDAGKDNDERNQDFGWIERNLRPA